MQKSREDFSKKDGWVDSLLQGESVKYFLTADTHFNHELMKESCGRPEGFEQLIVDGWKDLASDDILIHLGDVCIGNEAETHLKYIVPLKCKKILIRGNHDKRSGTWYMEHGWDWVCNSMTLERAGKKILFSHTPQVWDGYWAINFHGHFHNCNRRRWEAELQKDLLSGQRLLALEHNNYKLWDLDREIMKVQLVDKDESFKEALEDMVNQFAYPGTPVDGIVSITTGGLSALEGAFEALGYSDPQPMPHKQCQHEGCVEHSTCGTSTKDGYKHLCFKHYKEDGTHGK